MTERSEVTTYNQWTECKYRGITLLVHQHRLDQAKQLIDASLDHPNTTPKPGPTKEDILNAAQHIDESPQPYHLIVHPDQFDHAVSNAAQALREHGLRVYVYRDPTQQPGQWRLTTRRPTRQEQP